jgi:hypothetical protein
MNLTTSIDTNVLLLLWVRDAAWNVRASIAVKAASTRGGLSICGPAFSELLGLPGREPNQLQQLLGGSGIFIDWNLGESV